MITRRELLRRGGALAAATGAANLASLEWLARPAGAAGRMRKCMSLGGPGSLRVDGHPDDYLIWGNREYIRDLSKTRWVKLWVSWYDLQQELGGAPASRAESWHQLNLAPGGQAYLRRLDRQLKGVNDDGLGAILTLYQAFPTWSSGATGIDPVGGKKPAAQKLPLDLSPSGPWGWFIGYLLARYRKGAAPNSTGPHEPGLGEDGSLTRFGNPDGAWIDTLEICNEPNYLYWPQEDIVDATEEMIRSADELSATWAGTPILAPATSDYPDDADQRNSLGVISTAWEGFTERLCARLRRFQPTVPLRWSHHNYREVKLMEIGRTERVARLVQRLPGRIERQRLWLTEGGYNMGTHWQDPQYRADQARLIELNFRRTMRVSEVFMWTQHTINDKQGNSWKGGLRDDFVWGQGIGGPRPAWHTWRKLPGWSWQ